MDARVVSSQPFEHLRQHAGRKGHAAGQVDAAAAAGGFFAQIGQQQFKVVQQPAGHRQKGVALSGEHHFAGGALKQGQPNLLLQFAYGLGQRGLRQKQLAGGGGEAFGFGNGREGAQVAERDIHERLELIGFINSFYTNNFQYLRA